MASSGAAADRVRLDALLSRAAHEHGDRVAIRDDDREWSFTELDRRVDSVAVHLLDRGVVAGERVALRMANRVEVPVAVLASSRIGAVPVMISPAWKAREVQHALALTGAGRALVDDPDDGVFTEQLDDADVHDITTLSEQPAAASGPVEAASGPVEAASGPVEAASGPVEVAAEDDAVLVFSSGTTGMPKAVRHTHASLDAAAGHWVDALGLSADDRFQISTPPSHILGLLNLLAAIRAGAAVRLHRRFDIDRELATIEEDRLTLEMAVAPIVLAMAHHPDIERYDLSSLRFIMWGATPVTPSLARLVTSRTGVPVLAAYGASEVPVLAVNPVDRPDEWRLDSPGRAPAGVELRIVDPSSGALCPAGATGELEARSASAMAGYLPSSADDEAFRDGWYRTGDIGTVDTGGWVRLTDRAKDMIKVNGHQVAPAEIESVLLGHPAVQDCAVFGVPDARTGEAPVAAVALAPTASVDDASLQALVAGELAGYKRVAHVVRVAAVPRLPSGKALRRELREQWLTTHPTPEEDPT